MLTLLEEVLQHDEDGANGLMFDEAKYTTADDIDFDELGDLKLPVLCSRSTSCLSLNSDGLGAIFEADDSSADSWINSIARTGDWMADDAAKCIDGTEEVAKPNTTPAGEVVETTEPAAVLPPRIQNKPSTPPFCGLTTGSSSISIPRPTREFLVEGMTPSSSSLSEGLSYFSGGLPSFSQGDIKKQKIARYLEKRKRRLSRKRNHPVPISSTRRDIANKRARVNGRFVSVSEFGSASKRRR